MLENVRILIRKNLCFFLSFSPLFSVVFNMDKISCPASVGKYSFELLFSVAIVQYSFGSIDVFK